MPNYLEQRRQCWYAVLDVPKAVQRIVGKRRFVQSLKTDSRRRAERMVGTVVSLWQREIAKARGMDDTAELAAVIRGHRAAAAATGNDHLREDVNALAKLVAGQIEASSGRRAAERFRGRAMADEGLLEDAFDDWLGQLRATEKTKLAHRQAKGLLTSRFQTPKQVDRKAAADFVEGVLQPGRRAATVNKLLSSYCGLWRWLGKRGRVSGDNPWTDQRVSGGHAEATPRAAMPEREGATLIAMVEARRAKFPDDPDVLTLAAVTGLRLEEACGLLTTDIEQVSGAVWVRIRRGKTKNAPRRVPVVVPEVAAMLLRRVAGGGALFPELTPDKRGYCSPRISQRLGRVLRTITKDPQIVAAHCWRHRAATLMERAGIQPWTIEAALGHGRQGESAGRYSKGPSDSQLVEAVRAIVLPLPVKQIRGQGRAKSLSVS